MLSALSTVAISPENDIDWNATTILTPSNASVDSVIFKSENNVDLDVDLDVGENVNKSLTLLCRAYSPGEDDILSHESRSVERIFNKTCTSYHYSKYFIHGVNYPSIDNVNIEAEDNVDLSVDLDVGENVITGQNSGK